MMMDFIAALLMGLIVYAIDGPLAGASTGTAVGFGLVVVMIVLHGAPRALTRYANHLTGVR